PTRCVDTVPTAWSGCTRHHGSCSWSILRTFRAGTDRRPEGCLPRHPQSSSVPHRSDRRTRPGPCRCHSAPCTTPAPPPAGRHACHRVRDMTRPYGSWPSPLSAESLTEGALGLSEVQFDGTDLYWLQARPTDGGRVSLWRRSGN